MSSIRERTNAILLKEAQDRIAFLTSFVNSKDCNCPVLSEKFDNWSASFDVAVNHCSISFYRPDIEKTEKISILETAQQLLAEIENDMEPVLNAVHSYHRKSRLQRFHTY